MVDYLIYLLCILLFAKMDPDGFGGAMMLIINYLSYLKGHSMFLFKVIVVVIL